MTHKTPQSIRLLFSNLILRNVTKVIYKFFYPSTYKHNRRFWPYYKVERNHEGGVSKIYFKNKLVVENSPPDLSALKKCMLIATGPSIQNLSEDIFSRPDIDYMGINGAIALEKIIFKYYVIIDHNFTMNRFDLVLKVLNTDCTFYTTPRCLDLILRKVNFSEITCKIKIIEPITRGEVERFLGPKVNIDTTKNYFFIDQNRGFSTHISDVVFDYFTVAYVALQVIHALHYQEIYLAGLDMNNFSQPRFYESVENKQPTLLDQHLTITLPAFDTAAKFLTGKEIQVYNLSPQSSVNSFKKLSSELL